MPAHDPLKFASELSKKLATRSRHVCAFLGAGVGRACGLPDVAQLQEHVLAGLSPDNRQALAIQLGGRNLEQALSRLRAIEAVLDDAQTLDGMTSAQAADLDKAVCGAIVRELDIASADLTPAYNFAAWAARAEYTSPVELFTVNYDLLLETALEALRAPYFDGFVGSLRARFYTELVEGVASTDREWMPAIFVRLWKLHGSLNWAWEDEKQIIRLGQPVSAGLPAAIYPSYTKYEESRRVPFVVLQDQLRRALQHPETIVLIAGYSFADEHLNEMLFNAAARRGRSEFVAFCYGAIPPSISTRALTAPNVQIVSNAEAILGGVRDAWKQPPASLMNVWENNQFVLSDFRNLAAYLARSMTHEPERDALLQELIAKAATLKGAKLGANGGA